MDRRKFWQGASHWCPASASFWQMWVALFALALLAACNISKQDKPDGGKEVKITTPLGGLNVNTSDVDVKETGLALYPGAHPLLRGHDESRANVNITSSVFGLKVVALKYRSDDAPEKVKAFYVDELKKYGHVLECSGADDIGHVAIKKGKGGGKDRELSCEKDRHGDTVELKTGTENRQRIVAIKPSGSGSEFSLVYINARDKSETL